MTENDGENTVSMSVLLEVTRQKLVLATIANTELEAIIKELLTKISELESKS